MNAHKFVAEEGIDEAKRVLEGAPSEATHFEFIKTAFIKTAIYMQFCGGEWFWLNTNCNEWLLDYPNGITERQCLKELKQVVDSVELIRKLGGLIAAKSALAVFDFETGTYPNKLKQAIEDYEQVQAYKNGEA
ncbi:hypothetical protein PYR76_05920 [Acinetobacter soli]|nr:hypothetical protein [Acinetobacter soli]WEH98532.1 hypothetical protein PYR76_05920 [Acinetobacter soli]